MSDRSDRAMREYWNEKARTNAAWYVDTTLSFDDPDMERFWESGEETVATVLGWSPRAPVAGTAVEIGCGLGRMCRALARRFDRVIGVDISDEMIVRARELVTESNVEFLVSDGSSLEVVEEGSADLVFTFTVFQHIPDPAVVERYIEEIGRVLKPGGLAIFQWNNTSGALRWKVRRWLAPMLERLRRDSRGRHAAPFLGSRIPFARIRGALERGNMDALGTRGLGTLFAFVFAERRSDRR